jgi:membrane fusion protein, multidrug efflux system
LNTISRPVPTVLVRSASILLCLLAGCGTGGPASKTGTDAAGAAAALPTLQLAAEDVVAVRSSAFAGGPAITGAIQPERQADLRAEVSAVVLAVLKENGDSVRRGDLLVRLDDTAIRDSLTAAETAARTATLALEQAERQYQRLKTLQASGMVSAPQVEEAEIRRNAAQSEVEGARTRVVSARQQLQRTQVRAPFDGVVSDRKVSAGDTAQIGKELVNVIDPRSLRFEGFVSADHVGKVRTGQQANFRVLGFTDREFTGRVARVNPAANPTTRQVAVLVDFNDRSQQPAVAGLYAEGRLEVAESAQLVLPQAAVVRDGDRAFAWKLAGNTLRKVPLTLGARDARTGELAILAGLAAGDQVLRYPTAALHDGQAASLGR